MCWDGGGREAYVVDTRNSRVVSRDVVPKHWRIIKWVSWSPDERFALLAAGGEITMGDMVFVNVITGNAQEIEFRNFTNDRGIDPRETSFERIQDFDPERVAWVSSSSFRLNIDVRCNRYEHDEDCYEKVISSPVLVNLSPVSISYRNTTQHGNGVAKRGVHTREKQVANEPINRGIRQVDFLNFTYQTSLCLNDIGISGPVTVRNGEFKQGSDALEAYFRVVDNKVIYGDLTGDDEEEAVIHVACGRSAWNWALEDIFVYTHQNGRAVLLAEYQHGKMLKDYQRYYPDGVLWNSAYHGVRIRNRLLQVDWHADGAHCCPKYIATLEYRWISNELVMNGSSSRRVFK